MHFYSSSDPQTGRISANVSLSARAMGSRCCSVSAKHHVWRYAKAHPKGSVAVSFEVIQLDRETALQSVAEIRQVVLQASEGERIPVEIDDLDQLGDILDSWGVVKKPSQLDVQRALDRHAVWVGGIVAVRKLKGPGEIGRAGSLG
jgi:hypothetical protein